MSILACVGAYEERLRAIRNSHARCCCQLLHLALCLLAFGVHSGVDNGLLELADNCAAMMECPGVKDAK